MVYQAPHNVLQILGSDVSEAQPEIWSNTIRFSLGDGGALVTDDAALLTALNDDIAADLTLWWNALASSYSGNTKLTGFKFNAVDINGRYIGSTTNERVFATPLTGAGGTSASRLPLHLSLAVTFHTNVERGLAARGRMYLPSMLSARSDNSGRLDGTSAGFFADSTAQLLTNLGNWPGIDALSDGGTPAILSKVREGATRRISAVSIGDLWDSQRRRANALDENYTTRRTVTT
jgi:hypothetical protein